jgi:copper(I)-binding protein
MPSRSSPNDGVFSASATDLGSRAHAVTARPPDLGMLMMLRQTMIAIALLLPLATMGAAGAADAPKIERAWARATPGAAKTGAVYLRIELSQDDRLMGLYSPVAEETALHSHLDVNGVMQMRAIKDGLAVTAGETVELKPGGTHAMLMGLKRPLVAGESFPLTLFFEKAGARDVTVKVERLGAMGPSDDADADHSAMDHGAMDQNAMKDGAMDHGAMPRDGRHSVETPGS